MKYAFEYCWNSVTIHWIALIFFLSLFTSIANNFLVKVVTLWPLLSNVFFFSVLNLCHYYTCCHSLCEKGINNILPSSSMPRTLQNHECWSIGMMILAGHQIHFSVSMTQVSAHLCIILVASQDTASLESTTTTGFSNLSAYHGNWL